MNGVPLPVSLGNEEHGSAVESSSGNDTDANANRGSLHGTRVISTCSNWRALCNDSTGRGRGRASVCSRICATKLATRKDREGRINHAD